MIYIYILIIINIYWFVFCGDLQFILTRFPTKFLRFPMNFILNNLVQRWTTISSPRAAQSSPLISLFPYYLSSLVNILCLKTKAMKLIIVFSHFTRAGKWKREPHVARWPPVVYLWSRLSNLYFCFYITYIYFPFLYNTCMNPFLINVEFYKISFTYRIHWYFHRCRPMNFLKHICMNHNPKYSLSV